MVNLLDEKEFERWILSAEKTYESAKRDTDFKDYSWACFKAQQAAELAVKALFWGIGKPAFGHSITKLLSRLELDVPKEIINCAKALDKFYTPTRYPDVWAEGAPHEYFTRKDADEALECSKKIIDWVKDVWRKLSGED